MPTGTVKWFQTMKRFGFIEPEEGDKDIFVHMTAVEAAGLSGLLKARKFSSSCPPERTEGSLPWTS